MIDAAALAKMKPGAILINTSRVAIIDEPALVKALEQGQIAGAGAGADVIGGVTYESQAMAYVAAARKLTAYLRDDG